MSKVTFDGALKRINVNFDTTSLNVGKDLYSAWKVWLLEEETNMGYLQAFRTFGGDTTIPGQFAPKYFFLTNGWRVYVDGISIIVATNLYTDEAEFPFVLSNGAAVSLTNSDVAISDQEAIQYSSYGGAVNVDTNSGRSGTSYPTGNAEFPVDNIQDAVIIAQNRGFYKLNIISNLTLDAGDDVSDYEMIGKSHVNTLLTINPGAICLRTKFVEFNLGGTLDGDSDIISCTVGDIQYFNGHIHDSFLHGTFTLGGTKDARIDDCKVLNVGDPLTITTGTSGQDLMMSNISGRIIIDGVNGPSKIGIGIAAGEVTINANCDSGSIALGGNGYANDNSQDGCYVVDNLVNGNELQNLRKIIEGLRPHHTGTGDIWYWNPYNGNDAFDGTTPNTACKTFTYIHDNLVLDSNHDVVYCMPGNPTGITNSNENITISKNYVLLRGPGRDFELSPLDDSIPTVTITGNGAEVSGMRIKSSLTATAPVIHTTGDFGLFKNLWVSNSNDGIHIEDAEYNIMDSVKSHHNNGYGILIDGISEHSDIIDCHIGSNEDGIIVNLDATYHEVNIMGTTVIHKNSNYGVDISATSTAVIFGKDVEVFANTVGNINDLGSETYIPTSDGGLTNEEHDALLNTETLSAKILKLVKLIFFTK